MQLNVQCLRHWVPAAQIPEESRVGQRIQSLPFAILVSFPCDVVEGWWSVLGLGDHGDHETPRVKLAVSTQCVFMAPWRFGDFLDCAFEPLSLL